MGVRVQGAYIAYLMNPRHDPETAMLNINADASRQIAALKWGLFAFDFLLLVIFLPSFGGLRTEMSQSASNQFYVFDLLYYYPVLCCVRLQQDIVVIDQREV